MRSFRESGVVVRVLAAGALLAATVATGVGASTPTKAAEVEATTCTLAGTGGVLQPTTVGARTYQLYVPESLADEVPGTSVPLLLAFHGLGGSGSQHASGSDWASFAESHRFIVAFPDGENRLFRFVEDSPDVANARAIVADIAATFCVDPARIFATGHSNGAYFAQRLACDADDLFASVTEYAGGRPDRPAFVSAAGQGTPCRPDRGIAVGMFHGEDDALIRASEGEISRDAWAERLSCPPAVSEPVRDARRTPDELSDALGLSRGVQLRYAPCEGGVELLWRAYADQNHGWPDEPRSTEMKAQMWDFLMRHPHPAYAGTTQSPAKVTGGGQIDGADANFGFVVEVIDGKTSGHLNYVDRELGVHLRSGIITGLQVTGTHAVITGVGVVDGVAVEFSLEVDDLDASGASDRIAIAWTGYGRSGPVRGNVRIH